MYDVFSPAFLAPVLVYLALLVVITVQATRCGSATAGTDQDYFLAGRGVGSVLAFVSVVATETSVATVLVFPQVGFQHGLSLIWLCPGFIAGRWLVARLYLAPIYDNHRLSMYATVTNSRLARQCLSLSYLVAKFISSGVRFYLGGVALSKLFGWELHLAIVLIASIAGVYSLIGGLRAVVYTDQLQGYLILFAGLALVGGLWWPLDPGALQSLTWVNLDTSLSNAQFFPVLFLGGLVLSIGSHGADQDMLQRVLATPSLRHARRALILSGLGASVVIVVYLLIGVLLSAGVATGRLTGVGAETPLVDYVNMVNVPWVAGGFAVLLIAAAMSTLDSAMHSTGAVWKSILERDSGDDDLARPGHGRGFSLLSLVILTLVALGFSGVSGYRNFLDLAMSFMNYVNGGLIGVFTLFVWRRRTLGTAVVIAAIFTGFCVTLAAATLLEPRPGWTYTTLASAGLALLAAYLVDRGQGAKMAASTASVSARDSNR
jgi:Na+/proline symporter